MRILIAVFQVFFDGGDQGVDVAERSSTDALVGDLAEPTFDEMKHGPIALIDKNMPVICIATRDSVYNKVISNIEEVNARGGRVIAIAEKAEHVFHVPEVPPSLTPLVTVIPLQLLAYHIAVMRGCGVDKPRNLAKSVTVE